MPFQLIHTSSLHLLDSSASGYGTVARSVDMPAALYMQLPGISGLKETAEALQFSYRILTACGEPWHVLTCVQASGADYSGRACHTAHHLLFSQREVAQLLSHEQRLTPAGISLALLRSAFWVARWEGEPRFLHTDLSLSFEGQPDASMQPTWKQFTGHKANARALYTPPYHKECLLAIDTPMQLVEILALLHESDWLSHTRGWGATYTTAADETDHFGETLRIVVPSASPLIQRAHRTGHPVLLINTKLELPIVPPPSIALTPEPGLSQSSIMRTLSRSTSHYHYSEEPDWTLFDIPLPTSAYKKALLIGLGGLACCAALSIWYGSCHVNSPPSGVPELPESANMEQSPLSRLCQMLSTPYEPVSTNQLLQELSLLKGKSAEETWLAECANIIRQSTAAGAHHAAGLKRLCECARLLGLKDTELVQLYLQHATHALTPEEWQKQFDAVQAEEWLNLLISEPAVAQTIEQSALQSYTPQGGTTPQDTTPILATVSSSAEDTATESSFTSTQGRVSLIPQTVRCGEEIPLPLSRAFTRLPLTITTGRYIVSTLQKGDELQPSQTLDLSEDGYYLHISATENNGEYRLTPGHKDGKPVNLPEILLHVHRGKLHAIHCGDAFAVLSFPVFQQDDFYINIIMAPEFGIPIPAGKNIDLPEASELNFNLTPADIQIERLADKPRLILNGIRKKSDFPWILDKKQIGRHRFCISLPVLNHHNSMAVIEDSSSSFSCQKSTVSGETESLTTVLCEIEHKPALPERLESTFDTIANNPCCGVKGASGKAPSLAQLYALFSSLGNKKLKSAARKKLHQNYFRLLADPHFNKELRKILPAHQSLILTPEEASTSNFRNRRLRNTISKELDNPAVQASVLTGICQLLSRSMLAAYEQEKQNFKTNSQNRPTLMLQKITYGEHGELLWHFHMQPPR